MFVGYNFVSGGLIDGETGIKWDNKDFCSHSLCTTVFWYVVRVEGEEDERGPDLRQI